MWLGSIVKVETLSAYFFLLVHIRYFIIPSHSDIGIAAGNIAYSLCDL